MTKWRCFLEKCGWSDSWISVPKRHGHWFIMIYHLSMVSMFIVDIYLRLGLSETKRFLMMSFRGLNHGSGRNQVCQNWRPNLQASWCEFDDRKQVFRIYFFPLKQGNCWTDFAVDRLSFAFESGFDGALAGRRCLNQPSRSFSGGSRCEVPAILTWKWAKDGKKCWKWAKDGKMFGFEPTDTSKRQSSKANINPGNEVLRDLPKISGPAQTRPFWCWSISSEFCSRWQLGRRIWINSLEQLCRSADWSTADQEIVLKVIVLAHHFFKDPGRGKVYSCLFTSHRNDDLQGIIISFQCSFRRNYGLPWIPEVISTASVVNSSGHVESHGLCCCGSLSTAMNLIPKKNGPKDVVSSLVKAVSH